MYNNNNFHAIKPCSFLIKPLYEITQRQMMAWIVVHQINGYIWYNWKEILAINNGTWKKIEKRHNIHRSVSFRRRCRRYFHSCLSIFCSVLKILSQFLPFLSALLRTVAMHKTFAKAQKSTIKMLAETKKRWRERERKNESNQIYYYLLRIHFGYVACCVCFIFILSIWISRSCPSK